MPYLDEWGLWRHDKPQLVSVIPVTARSHQGARKFKLGRCPMCGDRLNVECYMDDADYDYDLALDHGYEDPSPFDENGGELFGYVVDFVECPNDECRYTESCGRAYYYNPKTNNYDLPAPLTSRETILAELKAAEANGQMRLFR